jgi:hypothetical protein
MQIGTHPKIPYWCNLLSSRLKKTPRRFEHCKEAWRVLTGQKYNKHPNRQNIFQKKFNADESIRSVFGWWRESVDPNP